MRPYASRHEPLPPPSAPVPVDPEPLHTGEKYPIDLPTALQLADAENGHVVFLQSAQAIGFSPSPQYTAFCSMYWRMPRRPFSRPRPLSRQPPKGVLMENCL